MSHKAPRFCDICAVANGPQHLFRRDRLERIAAVRSVDLARELVQWFGASAWRLLCPELQALTREQLRAYT